MLEARWVEHILHPKFELGTSKGPILARTVWYLMVRDSERPEVKGIGEAALFPGHSKEFPADVRSKLTELCANTSDWEERLHGDLVDAPCVRFAVEQSLRDLEARGTKQLFPSPFTLGEQGVPINGLVWMGDRDTMRKRLREQVHRGFTTVKMKIGALGVAEELSLLEELRTEFGPDVITLRVDANGAYNTGNVMEVLERLAKIGVHSIEQPLPTGLYEAMSELCATSPVPIALDEDLIGLNSTQSKIGLLDHVKPQHIVIKPSLVGGWEATREWIALAEARGIGWWITSALESSIGLNAIAQFAATLGRQQAQGLGTGSVYTNNIPSPLVAEKGMLWYRPELAWELEDLS